MRKNAKKQIESIANNAAKIILWYKPSDARTRAVEIPASEAMSFYTGHYKTLCINHQSCSLTLYKNSIGTHSVKIYLDIEEWEKDKEYFKVDWTQEEYDAMTAEGDKARAEHRKNFPKPTGDYWKDSCSAYGESLEPVVVDLTNKFQRG